MDDILGTNGAISVLPLPAERSACPGDKSEEPTVAARLCDADGERHYGEYGEKAVHENLLGS